MLLIQFLEKWLIDRALIDPTKISVYADNGHLLAGCCLSDPEYESNYTANVLVREFHADARKMELLNVALLRFAQQFKQCGQLRWVSGLLVNAVGDLRFELDLRETHTFATTSPGDPAALLQFGEVIWKPTGLAELSEIQGADVGLLPNFGTIVADTTYDR